MFYLGLGLIVFGAILLWWILTAPIQIDPHEDYGDE